MDPHARRMRHSSLDPNWRTPPKMVEALARTFPLDIDLASTLDAGVVTDSGGDVHYLGPDHVIPEYRNALTVSWHETGYQCGFLNPPYSITRIKELREEQRQRIANGMTPQDNAALEALIKTFRIEEWARKAYYESEQGFTTIGVFPYAPQTKWFRQYVMGHMIPTGVAVPDVGWRGHAALDVWRLSHRVPFLKPDGSKAGGANVNTCVIIWGPNPGFAGPWVPSGRFWSYRGAKHAT